MISLKMQEIVLKSYRKSQNFLGGSIYDLAPPLSNTLRGPCLCRNFARMLSLNHFRAVFAVETNLEAYSKFRNIGRKCEIPTDTIIIARRPRTDSIGSALRNRYRIVSRRVAFV